MKPVKFETKNKNQTKKIAKIFAKEILKTATLRKEALVIGLIGNLGSGKTVFAQGFASGFGIKKYVKSPTFVLVKIFKLSNSKFKKFYHIDAYRIKNRKEFSALGWVDWVKNPENIILIEWADRVKHILPAQKIEIKFKTTGKEKRLLEFYDYVKNKKSKK